MVPTLGLFLPRALCEVRTPGLLWCHGKPGMRVLLPSVHPGGSPRSWLETWSQAPPTPAYLQTPRQLVGCGVEELGVG